MRQTGDIHRKLANTEFPGKTAHAPMFKEYALNLSWVAVVVRETRADNTVLCVLS